MAIMAERPATPPTQSAAGNHQLLTPPRTGESKKRVHFLDEISQPAPKRLPWNLKSELDNLAENFPESLYLHDNYDPTSSDRSSDEVSQARLLLRFDLFCQNRVLISSQTTSGSPVLALEASCPFEGFPFMKLPLKIRRQIYELLLVVPALICVRQKHTAYHEEKRAYLYAERRELLPGIAYALASLTVNGYKFRFSRFRSTNVAILRVSKQIHKEAKMAMYTGNKFEIPCPSTELSPPVNFKIRLFPRGYQQLVQKLNVRVRSFYCFRWLVKGGFGLLKHAYRGLKTFTIILEMECARKGFGKQITLRENEQWLAYVERLHVFWKDELLGSAQCPSNIPSWVHLRVLFDGDRYDDFVDFDRNVDPNNIRMADGVTADLDNGVDIAAEERLMRVALRCGLPEAFQLLKKGNA